MLSNTQLCTLSEPHPNDVYLHNTGRIESHHRPVLQTKTLECPGLFGVKTIPPHMKFPLHINASPDAGHTSILWFDIEPPMSPTNGLNQNNNSNHKGTRFGIAHTNKHTNLPRYITRIHTTTQQPAHHTILLTIQYNISTQLGPGSLHVRPTTTAKHRGTSQPHGSPVSMHQQ
jgi:hypothetical protein